MPGNNFIKLIFILSILLPFVNAQDDLNSYSNVELDINLFSRAQIVPEKDSYELDYIELNLTFFPKQSQFLSVFDKKFDSNQNFNLLEREDHIIYNFNNPSPGILDYNANFKVSSDVNFKQIRNKINFPHQRVKSVYLQHTDLINSDDISIREQTNEIVKGTDDFYEAVYKIALWTNKNINYSLETLTADATQSSRWVLDNKRGVCDELTALFIAMLRSIGIEAKFVPGVSYSNTINGFGGHAWAEVYFPGEGWVPFDPTYGQYGYVDATHIKMQDSIDARESSIAYAWKYRDVDIDFEPFNFTVDVLGSKNPYKLPIDFEINLLENDVGPGSYAPLEIEIENLAYYYLPVTLYIVKGPSVFKDNKIDLLLKPGETKKVFKLIPVPDDLRKGFSYTSEIEVTDGYGKNALTELEYGSGQDIYSLEEAESRINLLNEKEENNFVTGLDLVCSLDKPVYTNLDDAFISCSVTNTGNYKMDDIKVCFRQECFNYELSINQEENIDFNLDLTNEKSQTIIVKAENSLLSKQAFMELIVEKAPWHKRFWHWLKNLF